MTHFVAIRGSFAAIPAGDSFASAIVEHGRIELRYGDPAATIAADGRKYSG
jgi:hypothetical protein